MLRSLAFAALALVMIAPAIPARAQDQQMRQLIGACVGCRLPHDLHGLDLHGLHFVGDDLRDVDFSHANLQTAEFTGDDLDGTRFDGADLRGAKFVGVHLRKVTLTGARLDDVRFVGVDVDRDVSTETTKAVLRDCTGCSLSELDLHGADLSGMKVVGANLHDGNLSGALLRGANLVGVNARGADFSHADLSGADVVATNFRDARLAGATFGDAILCAPNHETDWDGDEMRTRTACANLRGVDLHGLDLRAARWCDQRHGAAGTCRTVTRAELTDDAHADLTGALAPP